MTKNSNNDLATYYTKIAHLHDQKYAQPAHQADLAVITQRLSEVLADHNVLELACGTGYWTARYAGMAQSVLATDINLAMLSLAQVRGLPADKVKWELADAFKLPVEGSFNACFAGGWWSHVLRQEQEGFLQQLRQKLGKDALLVLIDSSYVEGADTTIARTDLEGNTFQIRTLPDGERCEVLKNYPTDSTLRKKLAAATREIKIVRLEHYWMLTCRLK